MFLHLGNDVIVNDKDIIGIFDIENTSVSKTTKNFLSYASKKSRVINCTYEMPKSFVVCLDNDFNETVYISQMSCATLLKRFKAAPHKDRLKALYTPCLKIFPPKCTKTP